VRDVALLTNPTSGKGKGARARDLALPRLRDAGLHVRELEGTDADDALRLAHEAVADGIDALIVCGGDGLVHLAAQTVATTGVPLGIIPAGTGNDVASYVDLPKKDLPHCIDLLVSALGRGSTRTLDLARAETDTGEKYFVTVLAAGFDAIVNERANAMTWPRGQMRYNLATLLELRTFTPLDYVLELDGTRREVDAMLCAVGNGWAFGGGLRITQGALLDDGLLDVVIIRPMSKLGLIRTYPKLFKGTHTTVPQYEHVRVKTVTVSTPGIVSYADGERFGPLPLTVTCVPQALKVIR
jgi:diacylglycerol kinase (ATP)